MPGQSPPTSVFVYAIGIEHHYQEPCREIETHPGLGARDAVLAALAVNRGVDAILGTDRVFDAVAGLERIDPADRRGLATIGGRAPGAAQSRASASSAAAARRSTRRANCSMPGSGLP